MESVGIMNGSPVWLLMRVLLAIGLILKLAVPLSRSIYARHQAGQRAEREVSLLLLIRQYRTSLFEAMPESFTIAMGEVNHSPHVAWQNRRRKSQHAKEL